MRLMRNEQCDFGRTSIVIWLCPDLAADISLLVVDADHHFQQDMQKGITYVHRH